MFHCRYNLTTFSVVPLSTSFDMHFNTVSVVVVKSIHFYITTHHSVIQVLEI